MNIPITKPYFDKEEEKAVIEVLRSGWHTQGPKVKKLENLIENFTGAKHAIAVSNCTAALHISLIILGIKPGDEVIVPSFSFIASANMIPNLGAKPIFIDVDPDTFNLDAKKLEKLITKKTKAVITVDQIGLASDIDEINRIARKHKLKVIADAACSLGATYKGKKVGSLADITCFSFHPRKAISTGEGGMITTNNDEYAKLADLWRNHGMSLSDIDRHKSKKFIYEQYLVPGFNYRMTDMQAAIGIAQMKKFSKILKIRKKIADNYIRKLGKNKYLEMPFEPKYAPHSWQSFLVRVKDGSPLSAIELMQKLKEDGIGVKRGIMASHLEPVYKDKYGKIKLPVTEFLIKHSFCIPIYPQLKASEQEFIISKINKYLS